MRKISAKANNRSTPLSCLPYGVGHDQEGVCLMLNLGEYRIMLDCGIAEFPSSANLNDLPAADFIFCSHAHRDHCRGLPQLNQNFPKIPIYTSAVTSQLLPLYWSEEIAQQVISQVSPLPWRSPVVINEQLQFELFPVGHLPGAAGILLTYKTKNKKYKVVYTGDFSLSNFQLVEGLSVENIRGFAPDILILEGSYGSVRQPHRRQQEKQLMERINLALVAGMNILLPVEVIGLAQEILKLLRSHHKFTGRDLDIWVDENIARACDTYLEMLPQFPVSVQNFARHQSLFWDERVCPRMQKIGSIDGIFQSQSPRIVLADKNADLSVYLNQEVGDWLVLFPESPHQEPFDPNFLGIEAKYNLPQGKWLKTESYLLAEHSDGRNTTQLIHNLRPQHVVLVHGLQDYLFDLAGLEELYSRYQIHSPSVGNLLEFPIGDRFIQPQKTTPNHYEGEINETNSYITLTFPNNLNDNPRWEKFANTGIVEATWQGDKLILRGINQKELLNTSHPESKTNSDVDCCQNCYHYHNQKCWNRVSPLYEFRVVPEGYCLVFESKRR